MRLEKRWCICGDFVIFTISIHFFLFTFHQMRHAEQKIKKKKKHFSGQEMSISKNYAIQTSLVSLDVL